jgi:flagellar protein FlaG
MNMEPIPSGRVATAAAGADPARTRTTSAETPEARGTLSSHERRAATVKDRGAAAEEAVSRESVEAIVDQANTNLKTLNQALSFKFHEASGQFMVQVVDRNTGEVVRESPAAEFLDLAVRMKEMVGIFLDETR